MVQGKFKWFIFTLLMFLTTAAGAGKAHPFYISVAEINYNNKSKSLEISCKIFTDDLETVLGKKNSVKPDLFLARDKEIANKQIAAYISERLAVTINGKKAVLSFLGFERENEAVWSYFECADIALPQKVEIMNSLLYDSFDQQINLLHVMVNGQRKSAKLVYPDSLLTMDFH